MNTTPTTKTALEEHLEAIIAYTSACLARIENGELRGTATAAAFRGEMLGRRQVAIEVLEMISDPAYPDQSDV